MVVSHLTYSVDHCKCVELLCSVVVLFDVVLVVLCNKWVCVLLLICFFKKQIYASHYIIEI